jgi:hypothetical protein
MGLITSTFLFHDSGSCATSCPTFNFIAFTKCRSIINEKQNVVKDVGDGKENKFTTENTSFGQIYKL